MPWLPMYLDKEDLFTVIDLCRVLEGLSRMRGNSHRFLGEGTAVMLLFYLTNKRNLCDAIVI
jgi:hypothetical protein